MGNCCQVARNCSRVGFLCNRGGAPGARKTALSTACRSPEAVDSLRVFSGRSTSHCARAGHLDPHALRLQEQGEAEPSEPGPHHRDLHLGVADGSKGRRLAKCVQCIPRAHKSELPELSASLSKACQSVMPECLEHFYRPRRLTLRRKGYFLQPHPSPLQQSPGGGTSSGSRSRCTHISLPIALEPIHRAGFP